MRSLLKLISLGAGAALCGNASDNWISWCSPARIQQVTGTAECAWNGDVACFTNTCTRLCFYPGRRKSEVNGTTVWLNAASDGTFADKTWRLSEIDLDFIRYAMLPRDEHPFHPLKVLLDPGHGGNDEGTRSKDPVVKEKDLTLTIARRLGDKLRQAGFQVVYTRTCDTSLSLDDRARTARKSSADLLISIHANHADNADAAGFETYVLPPCGYPGTADGSRARGWQIGNRNDYRNTLLGFSVQQRLAALPDAIDRGLKRQSFFVLRETDCPAILIECGFMSNEEETRHMLEARWQDRCAAAIADGVRCYAGKVDALDRAIAAKRARDEDANERWRQHLAAQAVRRSLVCPAAPAPVPPKPEKITPVVEDLSQAAVASHSAGTNTPVSAIESLIDFYVPDKIQ